MCFSFDFWFPTEENRGFSEMIKLQFEKYKKKAKQKQQQKQKRHTSLCNFLFFRIIVSRLFLKKMRGYPNFLFGFQKPLLRSAFPKSKILLSRHRP